MQAHAGAASAHCARAVQLSVVQVFERDPGALCTEIILKDSENKVWYHYVVQVRGA